MPKWRKVSMKIKGFIAGLGVAGKIALGAGVACAATTGAGAAGVLPGPVQHAFSEAVSSVTPFEAPGGDNASEPAHDGTTTTTIHDNETPTTAHNGDGDHHDGDGSNKSDDGDGNGVIVTPMTRDENHDGDGEHEPTPTTVHNGDGDGEHETTPTTAPNGDGEHHDGGGDGEHSTTTTTVHHENENPQSITLTCERSKVPEPHISCSWTADSNPAHVKYYLLRGDGHTVWGGNDLMATDNDVDLATQYNYVVISVDSTGDHPTVLAHSNRVYLYCCGD
jgi:hypothetical protein